MNNNLKREDVRVKGSDNLLRAIESGDLSGAGHDPSTRRACSSMGDNATPPQIPNLL